MHYDLSGESPVRIHRLNETEPTSFDIVFHEHLASGEEFLLQWGDIIEIPSREINSTQPDDKVTQFLEQPRSYDLSVTLGDNEILSNATNATGPIFRHQPKHLYESTENVRIAAGITSAFLSNSHQILRANPQTGELYEINNDQHYSDIKLGDRIHFHTKNPQPGPVTYESNTAKICQSLNGPYWHFNNSHTLKWLPHEGFASLLLALSQPHSLPLEPIDWEQSYVLYSKEKKKISLQEFFFNPPPKKTSTTPSNPNEATIPRQQVRKVPSTRQQNRRAPIPPTRRVLIPPTPKYNHSWQGFILVLTPAKEAQPFPEELKKRLTETLETSWNLKNGMEEAIALNWKPRFPKFTRAEKQTLWQAPAPHEQTSPALPIPLDLISASPEALHYKPNTFTQFPSQKMLRITPLKKKSN